MLLSQLDMLRSICLLCKRGIYIISKPTARAVISNLPQGEYIELSGWDSQKRKMSFLGAKHIDE